MLQCGGAGREAIAAKRGRQDRVASAGAGVQRPWSWCRKLAASPPDSDGRDAEHIRNALARHLEKARAHAMGRPHGADARHRVPAADRGLLGRGAGKLSSTPRKPTMNAAVTSAGVARKLSAIGSSAGMIGEVGWPRSEEKS